MSDLVSIRKEFIKRIKRELLGPGSEISFPSEKEELISTSPDVRYSIGILFPRDTKLNADNDDTNRVEDSAEIDDVDDSEMIEDQQNTENRERKAVLPSEEENLDEEIGMAAQNLPSSAGFTFFAKGNTDIVNLTLEFGTYRHARANDCRIPYEVPRELKDNYAVPASLS